MLQTPESQICLWRFIKLVQSCAHTHTHTHFVNFRGSFKGRRVGSDVGDNLVCLQVKGNTLSMQHSLYAFVLTQQPQ